MEPLKMLEKIREKVIAGDTACVGIHPADKMTRAKEMRQAIERLYNKVFPIPRDVGDWWWDKDDKVWTLRNTFILARYHKKEGYSFTLRGAAAPIPSGDFDAFEKLRDINPELLPPTEE